MRRDDGSPVRSGAGPSAGIVVTLALALPAAAAPAAACAQIIGEEISADTVGFGDRFELRVGVHLAPGTLVRVPATLGETEGMGGVGTVTWSVEPTADGGMDVSLVYGGVAYAVGLVDVPPLSLFTGPVEDAGMVTPVVLDAAGPGWVELPLGMRRLVVPGHTLWVTSVLGPQDVELGLEPRPADDVVGPSWNAAVVLSALAFASVLIAVGFVSGRDWWAAHAGRTDGAGRRGDPVGEARAAALSALDALIAVGCGDGAHAVEAVYERSSDVVRRYVEQLDAAWSPAHTSTELMRGLEAAGRLRAAGRLGAQRREAQTGEALAGLLGQMTVAETVKFGRLRPRPDDAIAHVRTLRRWVAEAAPP